LYFIKKVVVGVLYVNGELVYVN